MPRAILAILTLIRSMLWSFESMLMSVPLDAWSDPRDTHEYRDRCPERSVDAVSIPREAPK
ncbi:MAG TPA: hypothetical protein VGF48_02785 [Thermoanaerobaculia bacterium]|jgi:hypothetical protein